MSKYRIIGIGENKKNSPIRVTMLGEITYNKIYDT